MKWEDTILTQYSASNKLLNIIATFNQAVSIDDFTESFISDVWDIATNGSYGLDVWGKIVGVSRYIEAEVDYDSFGFSEADYADRYTHPTPFNDAPFYSGIHEKEAVRLGDDAYRTLILCKAFSNISIATIPEINKFLVMLFKGRGRAYSTDYGHMTMGIVCEFFLAPFEKAILENFDVMPIPSGVLAITRQMIGPYFGFATDSYPFNDGTFYRDL